MDVSTPAAAARESERQTLGGFRSGRVAHEERRERVARLVPAEGIPSLLEVGGAPLHRDAIELEAEFQIVLAADPGEVVPGLKRIHVVVAIAVGQLLEREGQPSDLWDAVLARG